MVVNTEGLLLAPVRLLSQSTSFRSATPKLKKYIYFKDTKEKDRTIFSQITFFVTQGVNFKQYSIKMFCLTNKKHHSHKKGKDSLETRAVFS